MSRSAKEAEAVLVTGAGGFIGGHVVRRLAAAGLQVRAHTGPPGVPPARPFSPGVNTFCGHIDDEIAVDKMVRGAACVVHLAGPPSVAASFREPAAFARAHVLGTANVVDACVRHRVRRLVYGSSAEVYGRQPRMPVGEGATLLPRSPYAAFKVAAEGVVRGSAGVGMECIALRFFSVYGPGMAGHSLVHHVFRQARNEGSVSVHNPAVVRDFVHVSDVADAVLAVCHHPLQRPYLALNVGSGTGTSVAEFAARVLGVFDKPPAVTGVAAASDRPDDMDIVALVADTRAMQQATGWRARLDLGAGLLSIAQELGAMPCEGF